MRNKISKLSKIASQYGSMRTPDNGHWYTEYYYDLLKGKQKKFKKVLEIGIGPKAPGLYMWRDFFPHAKIYGADNRGSFLVRRIRIESFHCDQTKKEDLIHLITKTGSDLDLVIDDGSHRPFDQVQTCRTLMPLLKKEVIYIIEGVTDLSIIKQLSDFKIIRPKRSYEKQTPDTCIVVMHKKGSKNHSNTHILTKPHKKGAKVSIIIPSCNEAYEVSPGVTVLQKTVQDIYEKATGNFEVIVGFNGPPYQNFPTYPNFKTVQLPQNIGIKTMINILAIMAEGTYIYKTDAHCMFGPSFDEILVDTMEDNWIVTPRFYVLNAKKWKWQDPRFYDYFYLCCPFTDPRGFRFKAGGHWGQRTTERRDQKYDIDETPQIHGSGWFVQKDFFINKIGGYLNIDPMGHAQESPYLCFKTWLGPWNGKVMVNKKTWYAHMHQDGPAKGYHYSRTQEFISYNIYAKYWMGDRWEEKAHTIDWFLEKFMPMPTWPDNWRELLKKWREENKNGV